jgi:hypothetical protein
MDSKSGAAILNYPSASRKPRVSPASQILGLERPTSPPRTYDDNLTTMVSYAQRILRGPPSFLGAFYGVKEGCKMEPVSTARQCKNYSMEPRSHGIEMNDRY